MQVQVDEQDDFNETHWQPLEQIFESAALAQTRFYRNYLMREGRYSLKNSTFVDFKDGHRSRSLNPGELVTELREFAVYEQWLTAPDTCSDDAIRIAISELGAVDTSTTHPLAMALLALYSSKKINAEEFVGSLNDLVSFVLRLSLIHI